VSVRIYVEGGGDQRATLAKCREGFAEFFKKALPDGPQPRIIACGSRNATLYAFKTALPTHPEAFVLLLVDAEAPVIADSPWTHLQQRDGWTTPAGATDEQAHLMVQCMEAWFLADRTALAKYYGQGFQESALPKRAEVEHIAKSDIEAGLKRATRATRSKGEYHKTRHGFDLLARIDAEPVRRASPFAERLCAVLEARAALPAPGRVVAHPHTSRRSLP